LPVFTFKEKLSSIAQTGQSLSSHQGVIQCRRARNPESIQPDIDEVKSFSVYSG
jgi:hypothetical protein